MSTRPRFVASALRFSRAAGAAALALLAGVHGAGAVEVTGDYRLIQRFVEDGAIVQKRWFEARAEYDDTRGGRDLLGTVTAALRLGRNIEAGAIGGLLDRRRDEGATVFGAPLSGPIDTTGLADATIYGKFRILRSPIEMALGAAAILPLADRTRGLGSGTSQLRGFMGLRRRFSRATLIGSLGATDHSDSRAPGRAPGTTAVLLGTGLLLPLSYVWTFVGEVNYDGPRFDGDGGQARAVAGLDWRPTENIAIRGALSRGISDAAPRYSATLSGAFHF